MGAASRPVWVSGLLALLVAGCVTPAPVAVDSRPQVTATRRGHGVIVIAGARTHYFENYHPHCLAYTLPGEWEFGIQEGMLRGVGGRRLLVGAMITSAEHLPGAP